MAYVRRYGSVLVWGGNIPVNIEFVDWNERIIRLGLHDYDSVVELVVCDGFA